LKLFEPAPDIGDSLARINRSLPIILERGVTVLEDAFRLFV
jgi:hypothetical protein